MLLAKMDEFGKPAWLVATLLAFWLFWPLGFAVLAYLAWSGRLYAVSHEGPGRWLPPRPGAFAWRSDGSPSGNRAFDEYRADTLRRLEEEHPVRRGARGVPGLTARRQEDLMARRAVEA